MTHQTFHATDLKSGNLCGARSALVALRPSRVNCPDCISKMLDLGARVTGAQAELLPLSHATFSAADELLLEAESLDLVEDVLDSLHGGLR